MSLVELAEVRYISPTITPELAERLTVFANARLDGVSPAQISQIHEWNMTTCRRYERWFKKFCAETERPYQPYVDAFTKENGPYRNPQGGKNR